MILENIGARAVFVSTKDDDAKKFYEKNGFKPLPSDSFKLLILIKDIKYTLDNPPI